MANVTQAERNAALIARLEEHLDETDKNGRPVKWYYDRLQKFAEISKWADDALTEPQVYCIKNGTVDDSSGSITFDIPEKLPFICNIYVRFDPKTNIDYGTIVELKANELVVSSSKANFGKYVRSNLLFKDSLLPTFSTPFNTWSVSLKHNECSENAMIIVVYKDFKTPASEEIKNLLAQDFLFTMPIYDKFMYITHGAAGLDFYQDPLFNHVLFKNDTNKLTYAAIFKEIANNYHWDQIDGRALGDVRTYSIPMNRQILDYYKKALKELGVYNYYYCISTNYLTDMYELSIT